MIWVGSFKSLQSKLPKLRLTDAPLEVHTWVQSEIDHDFAAGGLAYETDRGIWLCLRRGRVR